MRSSILDFRVIILAMAIDATVLFNELVLCECFLIAAIIPAYDNKKSTLYQTYKVLFKKINSLLF